MTENALKTARKTARKTHGKRTENARKTHGKRHGFSHDRKISHSSLNNPLRPVYTEHNYPLAQHAKMSYDQIENISSSPIGCPMTYSPKVFCTETETLFFVQTAL
jgi:hypothetical protein